MPDGTIASVRLTFLLILVLILAAVAAVASGWGGTLADAPHDRRPWRLPEGPLAAGSLDSLTFSPALRGYRCDEVDAVVDRLVGELADRDRRIATLVAEGHGQAPSNGPSLLKRPTEPERRFAAGEPGEQLQPSPALVDSPAADREV